ncbi:SHOCT domain-containing protein [Intestinibacillus massiliensis]
MAIDYCGGIPSIPNPCSVEISPGLDGIEILVTTFESVMIPLSNVKNVYMKSEEQISKDVTLTRVLLLGVFALGAKKKTKEVTNCLVIEYAEGPITCSAIFAGKKVPQVYSDVISSWRLYLDLHPEEEKPAESTASAMSTANEIEQYHDLMEKGIITPEEFEAKKKQLLGL